MTIKRILSIVLFLFLIIGCNLKRLPSEKEYSFYHKSEIEYFKDSIIIRLDNPIQSPLRYFISSKSEDLNQILLKYKTITLNPLQDSLILIHCNNDIEGEIILGNVLGDPKHTINKHPISLPFKTGSKYKVIQAYNGAFSHNHIKSRYAIDFNLQIGDTICAADDGFVVGVIEGYSGYGGKEWTEYANYIRLYHPASNLFTEYVHLVKGGSMVRIGDTVYLNQPIGICGMTGFTGSSHLHFNVKRATENGLVSEKIKFIEGYIGEELKWNSIVTKNSPQQ